MEATFSAYGKDFRPFVAAAGFSEAHDAGIIGDRGSYRGVPIPFGLAKFRAPEGERDKIAYLYNAAHPHLADMRRAGAESFSLYVTFHGDSGAIGFSREEIKMVAELDCDLLIDCVVEDESGTPLH